MASTTSGWGVLDSGAGVYLHIHTFLNGRIGLKGKKNLCEGPEDTQQCRQSLWAHSHLNSVAPNSPLGLNTSLPSPGHVTKAAPH